MSTITIPVSKERPEDDVFELVELLEKLYPDAAIKITNALVIETDNTLIAQLLKAVNQIGAPAIKSSNGNGKKASYSCPDCGAPVSKPGKYCRMHAQRRAAAMRKDLAENDVTAEELAEF